MCNVWTPPDSPLSPSCSTSHSLSARTSDRCARFPSVMGSDVLAVSEVVLHSISCVTCTASEAC